MNKVKEPYVQLSISVEHKDLARGNKIDHNFQIEFADQLAKLESFNKHLYRPNTYLHKWWARRCGTTFRAILKHLVDDKDKQNFYAPGGLEGKIILDPMMGGGTTLHEAIRLGANVVGCDIDSIPILQARATLTEIPLNQLKSSFNSFYDHLYTKLAHYYRVICPFCGGSHELKYVLYGAKKSCSCDEVIIVDSFVLRHNSDGSKIRLAPESFDILYDDMVFSPSQIKNKYTLLEKHQRSCESCGEKYKEDLSQPFYMRFYPIAIVGDCPENGVFFKSPDREDIDLISFADSKRTKLDLVLEKFKIKYGPKSKDLLNREITNYLDLFSSRQLLFLYNAIEELQKYESATRLKLAMLLSTSLEFNSMLCGYKGAKKNRPGAIRHTFAHHAYSFPSTALENNPLHRSRSSGTLQNLFISRLLRGYKWAIKPVERRITKNKTHKVEIKGEVDFGFEKKEFARLQNGNQNFLLIQGSSSNLKLPDESIDHIVTDPPYFDSVQYGDLAAYFRVWLKEFLPSEVNWDYELDEAAVDQQKNGNGQYKLILGKIFTECYRVLKGENGRLIFTFHHWNPKGWAGLTIALKRAGFKLVNRYVIHAENQSSVHIANQNALLHDVVFILGKSNDTQYFNWQSPNEIRKEDSYSFCEDCGTLVGFLLNSSLTEEEISAEWSQKLTKSIK